MQLEIINFIHTNPDKEEKLAGASCFIKTKRLNNLVLLKYNQINSDSGAVQRGFYPAYWNA